MRAGRAQVRDDVAAVRAAHIRMLGHLGMETATFRAVQEAGIAALAGPQDTVEERRGLYEQRLGADRSE